MTLDFKSLLIIFGPVNILIPIFAFFALRHAKEQSNRLWFIGSFFLAISYALVSLRGTLPLYLGLDFAQTLVMVSGFAFIGALNHLNHLQNRPPIIIGALILNFILFQYIHRHFSDKYLIIYIHSVYLIFDFIIGLMAWKINRRVNSYGLKLVAIGFFFVVFTNTTRILMQLLNFNAGTLLAPKADAMVAVVGGLILALCANFGYFAFVIEMIFKNKRSLEIQKQQSDIALNESLSYQEDLKKLIKERDTLLSTLSHQARVNSVEALSSKLTHEINQPLTTIMLNAEHAISLLDEQAQNNHEIRLCLNQVIESNQRASSIVDKIRAMVKNKSIEIKPFGLRESIQLCIDLIDAKLKEFDIRLIYQVPDDDPMIIGDRTLFQGVVLNLLQNSLDSLSEFNTPEKTIRISCEIDETFCIIDIADNGEDIPQEAHTKIFSPFFSSKKDGLGLGLAISRISMEHMSGKLEFLPNHTDKVFRITALVQKNH